MKFKTNKAIGLITILLIYLIAFAAGYVAYKYIPIPEANFLLKLFISDVIATIVVFLFSFVFKNASIYDPYWSVLPMVFAAYIFIKSNIYNPFTIIVLVLVELWGFRLTFNCVRRFKNLGVQDWRYTQLKEKHPKIWILTNFFGIHLIPTLVVFVAMIPLLLFLSGNGSSGSINLSGYILSVVICLGAIIIELVSDIQMDLFKKRNQTVGEINRIGLWKVSRHPNYFGEIAFWFSMLLFLLTTSPSLWPLFICPFVVFFLFAFISIPMMEKRLAKNKVGFAEYKKQTNVLLPIWPPYVEKK